MHPACGSPTLRSIYRDWAEGLLEGTGLARGRTVRIAGKVVAGTPLLLPSYSSRALSGDARSLAAVRDTVDRTLGLLVGSVLISAHDLDGGAFSEAKDRSGRAITRSPLTFIDSGGYETNSQPDGGWTRERHVETIRRWPGRSRAVMVGFDVPSPDLGEQIDAAASLLPRRGIGRELLIKPAAGAGWSEPGGMLDLVSQVASHPEAMRRLDVVGVTEKEVGGSLRERLDTIMRLRGLLDAIDPMIPLHVFGGLDPELTPLYFLAGADVFDGLSWLRYAYSDGGARYIQPAAALAHPDLDVDEAAWLVRRANFSAINTLETSLKRLVGDAGRRDGDPVVRLWLARAARLGIPA